MRAKLREVLEWFLDLARASNPEGIPFATNPDPDDFVGMYGNEPAGNLAGCTNEELEMATEGNHKLPSSPGIQRSKVLNVFFDTEFTKFRSAADEPKLISIGLVAEDGREFYAELRDTWDISDCSQFVISVVLEMMDNKELLKEADVAAKLKDWIEGLGAEEVVLRCDAPSYDWTFVAELFNFYSWPSNLRRKCGTVYFDNDRQAHRYQAALAMFWRDNIGQQHHALVDARSMRFAWKFAIRRGM